MDDSPSRQYDPEYGRLKLLNLTLQSENDLLREELQMTKLKYRERHLERENYTRYTPTGRYAQDYNTVNDMEERYRQLEAENRNLRADLSERTTTKLRPVEPDSNSDEVVRLKDEIRRLRDTIDKLSHSLTTPSKSKSPSPVKSQYTEGPSPQKQNLHSMYYDRSTSESAMVLDRHQAM